MLAVTAAFASGFLVAQGRGGDRPTPRSGWPRPASGQGLSCDELRQRSFDRALERVTAWGWDSPAYDVGGTMSAEGDAASPRTTPRTATPSTTSQTGTNVQETGVDEPDL